MTNPDFFRFMADDVRNAPRRAVWLPSLPLFDESTDAALFAWIDHTDPGIAARALEKLPDIRRRFIDEYKPRRFGKFVLMSSAAGGLITSTFPELFMDNLSPLTRVIAGGSGALVVGGVALADARHGREADGYRLLWRQNTIARLEEHLQAVINPPQSTEGLEP